MRWSIQKTHSPFLQTSLLTLPLFALPVCSMLLNRAEKKERTEKDKDKGKDNDKKDNKMEKRGLEYIDDFEEEDDPLFKVEKIKDLKKEKDNFLALLNKPTEEVNLEEENNDVIVDNIGRF